MGMQFTDPTQNGLGLADVMENHGRPSNFPQRLTQYVHDNFFNSGIASPRIPIPNDCRVGDLLIAVLRVNAGGGTVSWPSGWNEMLDSAADASDDTCSVAYHIVDGLETEGFIEPSQSAGAQESGAVVFHIRNGGVPTMGTIQAATTTTANPGDCNPAAGAKDYLWLTVVTLEGNITMTTPPTNYANQSSATNLAQKSGAGAVSIWWADRELNAASENAGAWSAHTNANLICFTIGIPPA